MTQIAVAGRDNRRAIVRAVSTEVLKSLTALAQAGGGDTISLLVFTGIWTANTQHLIGTGRYTALEDIPPDSQRRPILEADLERAIGIPQPILGDYVTRLIAGGIVERLPAGLVVPSAIFTTPQQVDGTNEFYARIMSIVRALRDAGFSFGDQA
ncbi:MAG: hypothetical protein ACK41C_09425 [Phenylobacterium sp.]|jgi:hypothetical protein|uniref:hypothetical protein n=1 Tax=Phenylobacterium sp. TaxID=1871053 RepID=UPI00391C5282